MANEDKGKAATAGEPNAVSAGKGRPASRASAIRKEPEDSGVDSAFVDKLAPWLRTLRNYTRLKVDGLDNIPPGPAILAANHTGWLGLDYALTALSVYDGLERLPRGMAHAAWFKNAATARFASRVGLFEVSKPAMAQQLRDGNLVMVFPEGEHGAFRPASDYKVLEFARGFVRVAMATGSPVVPVAILGGEEANPVGRTLTSYEDLLALRGGLPVPKNLWPKPVKWRIRFLPAIPFTDYSEADAEDSERVHALAEDVRTRIQREIRKLKVERGNPWI
jgi:1-acyl-sn-glycerol-3-phosphate acyltransferase